MLKQFLARLGERLYLKYTPQKDSLDRLFRLHIGERKEMTHAEFKRLSDGEKQSIYLECKAFMNNPVIQRVFQWELEEQSIDTMREAANEFQFLLGKMSVYSLENIRKRFELYARNVNDSKPESFDNLSPL